MRLSLTNGVMAAGAGLRAIPLTATSYSARTKEGGRRGGRSGPRRVRVSAKASARLGAGALSHAPFPLLAVIFDLEENYLSAVSKMVL